MSSKTGRVKSYSNEKGYGFISIPAERDLFFHISHVLDQLPPKVGDHVTFARSWDEQREREYADQVRVVEVPRYRPPRTLRGFPCIPGQEISGFRVAHTFGQLLVGAQRAGAEEESRFSSPFDTIGEARAALIKEATSKGANAVFGYYFHRDYDYGQFRAEGEAVLLVPSECCFEPEEPRFRVSEDQEVAAGFRVAQTFGRVHVGAKASIFSLDFKTPDEAREALTKKAKSKGANAVTRFQLHECGEYWAEGVAVQVLPESGPSVRSSTPCETFEGFPCTEGSAVAAGFRVAQTFGRVHVGAKASFFSLNFNTPDEARAALIKKAKSKGADAVTRFQLHECGKYWAEGVAVRVVPVAPDCSSCPRRGSHGQ